MDYNCKYCNYFSSKKNNFSKHLETQKHQRNLEKYKNYDLTLKNSENCAYQGSTKEHKRSTMEHKFYEIPEKKYFCEFCEKKLSSKKVLKRHQERHCKKNKNIKKLELFDKMLENKKIKRIMEKEIENNYQINNCNNTINNNSNNNITININNYGDENMDILNDNFLKNNLLKMPFTAIPELIEKIHFNNEFPENKNIRILNKRDNKMQIRKNDKWEYVDKIATMKYLIEDKNNSMDELYKKNQYKLLDKFKERYMNFQRKFDKEDEQLWKDILMQSELVFWNNM